MKKLLLSLLLATGLVRANADEGMWLPMLIGKNYEEMKKMGLKLSKDDLYNINNSSLKDAIIQFGGGCTGEMISPNGLLITNHHCGYGAIATLSSVEKNYLDNGFWAYSYSGAFLRAQYVNSASCCSFCFTTFRRFSCSVWPMKYFQ